MLTAALVIGLLPQGFEAPSSDGGQAVAAATVEVRGPAELSPAEAYDAARRQAREQLFERFEERALDIVAAERPAWLPAFVSDQAVRSWLQGQEPDRLMSILDRADRERFHEFGESYQTTLVVAENTQAVQRAEHQLRQGLRAAEKQFLMKGGAVVLLWALLGLVGTWLDRLSRGYMTGRLWLLGLLVGTGIPAGLFLL